MLVLHGPLRRADEAEVLVIGFGLVDEHLPLIAGDGREPSFLDGSGSFSEPLGQGVDI